MMDYDKEAVKRKLAELQAMLGVGEAELNMEEAAPEMEAEEKDEVVTGEVAPPRMGNEAANMDEMKIMEMMAENAPKGRGPVGLQEKAAMAQKSKMMAMKK